MKPIKAIAIIDRESGLEEQIVQAPGGRLEIFIDQVHARAGQFQAYSPTVSTRREVLIIPASAIRSRIYTSAPELEKDEQFEVKDFLRVCADENAAGIKNQVLASAIRKLCEGVGRYFTERMAK